MIVAREEIELAKAGKRSMMRLPVAEPECPLRLGHPYRLQPAAFTRGEMTITVTEITRERLDALSYADARKEGYAWVASSLAAFRRSHGAVDDGQLVWVVSFARGDRSEFMLSHQPHYLTRSMPSPYGAYTTRLDKACRTEAEPPYDHELESYVLDAHARDAVRMGPRRGERDRQRERRAQHRARLGKVIHSEGIELAARA